MKGRDLTGMKFERLLVLAPERADRSLKWICQCDCGEVKTVFGKHLKSGAIKSCGCFARDSLSARQRTHGQSKSRTYKIWSGIIYRCNNKSSSVYQDYGGRGIKVCKRWLSFENFLADMGERPNGMEIDRIDNEGHYEPSNCRWATRTENCRNKRTTLTVEYQGVTKSLKEWAEDVQIKYTSLYHRIFYAKMPVSVALSCNAKISNAGWKRDTGINEIYPR